MARTVIAKANPNRWPIRVVKFEDDDVTDWCVEEADEYGSWDDCGLYDSEDEAMAAFNSRVAELQNTPNCQAQAEYDERHGTDNGYSPWQFSREY
jgi:hypothetical protein